MTARIPMCLALALTVMLAPAAIGADLQKDFQALEQRLLEAWVDGDGETLSRLISPKFEYLRAVEQRPVGGTATGRPRQADLGLTPPESFEIQDSRVRRISDDVVLTVTRVTLNRSGAEAGARERQNLLTSTWLRGEDGAWRIVTQVSVKLGTPQWGKEAGSEAWRDRFAERWRGGQWRREPPAAEPAADPATDREPTPRGE